ncbi:hypothetical protein IWW33_001497 [Pseudomonas sp. BG2dil]|nr:hypothetical protein [Pseudomonas sp. M2]
MRRSSDHSRLHRPWQQPGCACRATGQRPAGAGLRESAGEETDDLGQWWTDYQDASDSERREMIRELGSRDEGTGAGPRKRKRSNSKRKRGGDEAFE